MDDDAGTFIADPPTPVGRRCLDFDDDCADIEDKFHCWKYDPERGLCPYLTGEIDG